MCRRSPCGIMGQKQETGADEFLQESSFRAEDSSVISQWERQEGWSDQYRSIQFDLLSDCQQNAQCVRMTSDQLWLRSDNKLVQMSIVIIPLLEPVSVSWCQTDTQVIWLIINNHFIWTVELSPVAVSNRPNRIHPEATAWTSCNISLIRWCSGVQVVLRLKSAVKDF